MHLLAGFLLRGKSRDRHFHFGPDQVANEILHTWGQYKRPSDWQQKYIQDWILQMQTTE